MEQKNRILIVEDDTDINNLLYTALQKAGYETVQAFFRGRKRGCCSRWIRRAFLWISIGF